MFTGIDACYTVQSTGAGGLGTVKMFRAKRAQSTTVLKLLSIYHAGSSWLTGPLPMKVNLKHTR